MSKIGKPGKDKAQKRHAMNRAEHRLRFHLSEKEYEQIIKGIQSDQYKVVEKQSNRVSKFLVKMHDEEFVVVYDKKRKTIITFLYSDIEDDSILKKVFGWLKH